MQNIKKFNVSSSFLYMSHTKKNYDSFHPFCFVFGYASYEPPKTDHSASLVPSYISFSHMLEVLWPFKDFEKHLVLI